MPTKPHTAVFIDNDSEKGHLIDSLLQGNPPKELQAFEDGTGTLFSKLALERFMVEEDRHGTKILTAGTNQNLSSMSSGERKKALLHYLLDQRPDFMVLDNPFDNLDRDTQAELKIRIQAVSEKIAVVQLISRKADLLPFMDRFLKLDGNQLVEIGNDDLAAYGKDALAFKGATKGDGHPVGTNDSREAVMFQGEIPPPIQSIAFDGDILADLKSVDVSYRERPILKDIDWTIRKGEFWELRGNNGSGKTTILSMITGENPKGYGQELYLFGRKKGSGESVWDIKKNIGYFTPAMTDKFTGYHTVEHMMVSGLNDSIGLYVRPTEVQLRRAREWLQLIGLWEVRNRHFHYLTIGQKRLVMCARAMIKHPPLLILDEPTAGLDDASAALFVALVNQFANESETTIIFVSHREEPGLEPDRIYELEMTGEGSVGQIKK